MMIVGLTGSIAKGKSTVADFFKELGAFVIDLDVLGHEVIRPRLKAWREIVEYFGEEVLNQDLTINRQKLGEIVFNDRGKLKKLNQIVHPEVFKEEKRITEEILSRNPGAMVIKDIPLLPESYARKLVSKIIVVYASKETQIKRLINRGINRQEAIKRIRAQTPLSEKIKFADFVIYNDGPVEDTKKQVEQIYKILSCNSSKTSI
jgi:dephospho-CoA kinase